MSSAISFISERLMDTYQTLGLVRSLGSVMPRKTAPVAEEVLMGWMSAGLEVSMLPHMYAVYL